LHRLIALRYPAYTKVTRDDVSAIWAYLRTLEPVRNPRQLSFAYGNSIRRDADSKELNLQKCAILNSQVSLRG
jgi:hypothetical protein